jgi:hypothetical protein
MHKLLIPIVAAASLASNPCSSQADDVAQAKLSKPRELLTVSSWLMEVGGRYLTSASKYNHSKPEQRSPADAVVDQRYAVWTIPHYPLVAFVADPRWRERGAAFASTLVTNNPDHCFTAPISPAITGLDNDASRQSLRLWCGGAACSYTPTEAFSRCVGNLELSQHR